MAGSPSAKVSLDQWNCETPTFGDGESKRNSSAAASSDMGGMEYSRILF